MQTCKECLCCEVCDIRKTLGDSEEARFCPQFKDRSKFIELPCKVGDMLYQPVRNIISKYEIISFTVYKYVTFVNLKLIKGIVSGPSSRFIDDIGVVLFLTREEAEQALEELNENRSD